MLNSIKNHVDAVGKVHVEVRVVDHAAGVDLFEMAKTDKDLAQQLDALRSQGVRFRICANTLRERKIDWHDLCGVKAEDNCSKRSAWARPTAWSTYAWSPRLPPDAGAQEILRRDTWKARRVSQRPSQYPKPPAPSAP
jgi:hypothetical protein